eukprot:12493573-Alexandrium_andersonii.AAC.1
MHEILGSPLAPGAGSVALSVEMLRGLSGPHSADGGPDSQGLRLSRQALHCLKKESMTGERRRGIARGTTALQEKDVASPYVKDCWLELL